MRIAVMHCSYASQLLTGAMDTAATIRHAAALGVDAVELMDHLIDEAERPAIERALAETGCRVIGYDLRADFTSPDPAVRRAAVAQARQGLARATAWGASFVLLFPGRLAPGQPPAQARRWVGEGLSACVEAATRLGVLLTIENLGIAATLCGTAEHLLELSAAVGPAQWVTFDAGNSLLAGDDTLAALAAVWPRVVHVHLKDWTVTPADVPRPPGAYAGVDGRGYLGVALGDGVVDLTGVLAALRRLGYTGWLSVEYEGATEPRAAVERGVAFLRSEVVEG